MSGPLLLEGDRLGVLGSCCYGLHSCCGWAGKSGEWRLIPAEAFIRFTVKLLAILLDMATDPLPLSVMVRAQIIYEGVSGAVVVGWNFGMLRRHVIIVRRDMKTPRNALAVAGTKR
jgi:hypothetical protein